MKQVVIFGGAFDPPHLGHELVIRQALAQLKPDELWIMPCYGSTFGKQMSPVKHRLAMCKLMVVDPRVQVSTLEIDNKLNGSTYETWKLLQNLKPSFLIGSDQLPVFHKWKNYQELLKLTKFWVYPRAGYKPEPWYPEMGLLKSPEISDVSSSEIRESLKKGKSIKRLVSARVDKYIQDIKVYD